MDKIRLRPRKSEVKRFDNSLMTRDSMTDDEFDEMMREGLVQAKSGDTIPFDKAFDTLTKDSDTAKNIKRDATPLD